MDLDLFKLVIALRGSADNLKQVLKQTYRGGLADDRYSKTFTEDYLKLFRELLFGCSPIYFDFHRSESI